MFSDVALLEIDVIIQTGVIMRWASLASRVSLPNRERAVAVNGRLPQRSSPTGVSVPQN